MTTTHDIAARAAEEIFEVLNDYPSRAGLASIITRAIDEANASANAEWQPIESAPKDGTRLILWFQPNEVDMPSKSVAAIGHWKRFQWRDGNEKLCGEPFFMWQADASLGPMSFAPTHWTPLPPPPTDAVNLP